MKARKPRVSSWSSRMRPMCSIRSASVSTWPYIIVAVVDMPSRCAWRMTFSQSVVPALHQDAGSADCERLLDLLEDDGLRQQIALGAVAWPAVEGTEVAVGDADVRVVDVAVDDERDPAGIALARAEHVGRLPNRHQVLRLQQRQRVRVGDPLTVESLVENWCNAFVTVSTHLWLGSDPRLMRAMPLRGRSGGRGCARARRRRGRAPGR